MKAAVGTILLVGATAFPFGQQPPSAMGGAPGMTAFRDPSGAEGAPKPMPSDGFVRLQFRADGAEGQWAQGAQGVPFGAGQGELARGFATGRSLYGMVTGECRTAVAATCSACAAMPHGAEGADDSCAEQCADRTSESCRTCRQELVKQCRECIFANSADLISAGCTQIACRQATQQLCPVCEADRERPMDESCRFCTADNTTDVCVACVVRFEQRRESEQQCRVCVEENADALITAGCKQLGCKVAVGALCPACESAVAQEDCRFCVPDNTTDVCTACKESREACVECVQANNSSLPEGCAFVLKQRPQSGNLRSFGDNGQGVARVTESEECRAAEEVTCPACRRVPNTDSDSCVQVCAEPRSEECAVCLLDNAKECQTCRAASAATLIAAGCKEIACNQATQQACPVCVPTKREVVNDCLHCSLSNATETCVACRAEAEAARAAVEQCSTCMEENFELLADSGCTQFACQRAAHELCAACARVTVSRECRTCRPDNASETCAACQTDQADCMSCLQASQSAMPEECAAPKPLNAPQAVVPALSGADSTSARLARLAAA